MADGFVGSAAVKDVPVVTRSVSEDLWRSDSPRLRFLKLRDSSPDRDVRL